MMSMSSHSNVIIKRAILFSFVFACQTRIGLSITDLTGFSYKCGGLLDIGFDDDSKIFCGGTPKTAYECGKYQILNQNAIEGRIKTATQQIQWIAQDMTEHDGILVSFTMDYVEDYEPESSLPSLNDISDIDTSSDTKITCYVTSKYWREFNEELYGVTCPVAQDQGEKHELTFGHTGDVAFRTELTVHSAPVNATSHSRPSLAKDFFGVYTWTHDGALRMYFGPQGGQKEVHIKNGRMTHQGFVYLDGLSLPGPCVAASSNFVSVLKDLPREGGWPEVNAETSGAAGASWAIAGSGLLMTVLIFGVMV